MADTEGRSVADTEGRSVADTDIQSSKVQFKGVVSTASIGGTYNVLRLAFEYVSESRG